MMNEDQLKQFIYCCQKKSLKLHFNNSDGIVEYMDERLERLWEQAKQNYLDACL